MLLSSDFINASSMLLIKDTIQDGVKKDDFYRFIANNHFEKASHGIYISPEAWEDESFILHQRCPQAVFYHALTDREPMQQTITILIENAVKSLTLVMGI